MREPQLQAFLDRCRARVETALDHWLPADDIAPARLHQAMRYVTLGAGKRVRPVLVYGAGEALGVAPEQLDGAAAAIELIHAYSLVHDDLPAMDDDDLRRGRPTCHRAFDEATAILVGDALQSLAFQVVATDPALAVAPEARLEMVAILARAAGSRGMAGGQMMDLEAVGNRLDIAALENMHIHKTGALIRASVQLGTLCHPEPASELQRGLDRYAKCVGLAFQIRDDILDEEGNTATLGKTQGKDRARNKPTYTTLMGLDAAREKVVELHAEALANLTGCGPEADPLRGLADYIVLRDR